MQIVSHLQCIENRKRLQCLVFLLAHLLKSKTVSMYFSNNGRNASTS